MAYQSLNDGVFVLLATIANGAEDEFLPRSQVKFTTEYTEIHTAHQNLETDIYGGEGEKGIWLSLSSELGSAATAFDGIFQQGG